MALNSELDSKLRELTFSSSQDHLNIILSQLNSNYMDMYNPFGARDSLEIKSMLYALLTSQDFIAFNNINQRLASKADDLVGSPDRSLQLIGGTLTLILVIISAAIFASSGVVGVSIANSIYRGFIRARHGLLRAQARRISNIIRVNK